MNCEKCIHEEVCHRYLTEPRIELDLTGCSHFVDIDQTTRSYMLGYLKGCEETVKKIGELNSLQNSLPKMKKGEEE